MMDKIYSLCREGLVWMGEYLPVFDEKSCAFTGTEADFESQEWTDHLSCFDFGNDKERKYESITRCSSQEPDIDSLRHCAWILRLLAEGRHYNQLPPFSIPEDEKYNDLVEPGMSWLRGLPWFKRLWTVQEAVLAPKVTVVMGHVSMPYDVLVKADANLSSQKIPGRLPGVTTSATMAAVLWFLKFWEPVQDLRVDRAKGKTLPLLRLCIEFNEHMSTVDLDRVYSLLGLVSNSQGAVVPDYTATASQVFTQLTARYIVEESSLLPLVFAPWRYKYPDIPSWAIDWTVTEKDHPSIRTSWADVLPLFNACGDLPARPISIHENVLSLSGVEVDTVSEVTSMVPFWGDIFHPPPDWRELILRLGEKTAYPSGGTWTDAFWRTLSMDCCWNSHAAKRATRRHIESFATYSLYRHRDLVEWDNQLDPPASTIYQKYENDETTQDILTSSVVFTRMRVIFATENGYLGIGNSDIAKGDRVFIFPTLQAPIVLRPKEEERQNARSCASRYTVVSESYVHGLMDGEISKHQDLAIKEVHIV